jgi:cellulose synthase/poly-beta-1,6-N-acetylglucosamine synthase-like glycosyltransferase/peptidoglycan/xylan/chitin deacetylase (PgdA/CDA1 family)
LGEAKLLLSGDHHRSIFYDPSGRRAYLVATINWAALSLLGSVLACLLATSIWGPVLPPVQLTGAQRLLSSTAFPPPPSVREPLLDPRHGRAADTAAARASRYGYFVNWDDNSFSSLKRNAQSLDGLFVEWLHLSGSMGALTRSDPGKEALVRGWVSANAPQLKLFPLVNNYNKEEQRWDGSGAARMLASAAARAAFLDEVYQYAVSGNFAGLVINFEDLPALAHSNYVVLVTELSALLHTYSRLLFVAVPPANPNYEYLKLAAAADALIVTSYDEHYEAGNPGPLAGQGWFEATLRERFNSIPANKLIVAIGSYGYDWAGPGVGKEISVQEAWELLEQSGATFRFDRASLNPTFAYTDDIEHTPHHVWYLDGVTGFNQIGAALAMRPAGLALWRLGTEDPSLWAAFARGRKSDAEALNAVRELRSGYDVLYKGKGEALTLSGTPEPGVRLLSLDAGHNLITDQRIAVFPKSTTVNRWGAREDKVIALTFDDGPDETYTPPILDILQEKGVKATFFVIGSAAAINSNILRRMYAEGHDIGNHTFTHVNAAEASIEQLKLEINATQRLFEATLGVHTKLFRPPYARDIEPQTIDGTAVLQLAASLGYITIGMTIDPKDWFRPRAEQIVQKTIEDAIKRRGNVVLLHDAGGVRRATVEALPQIIDKLHADGFRFVTVHELLGLPRSAVIPEVARERNWIIASNHAGFLLYRGAYNAFILLFYIGLSLGVVRLLWVCYFAILHARREAARLTHTWTPRSLAIVIPAYNEERVICASIRALLASPLRKFRIIVVDDGSTDKTVAVVRTEFGHTRRVVVVTKKNEGKWSALNHALANTDAQILVTLDADTLFQPHAIPLLVRHFADPTVAAVAGAASVGNTVNLLTRLQAVEYVTNQNLDRRALELVNGITVVPGSIGAWRREALLSIGGFHADTLAEDADATIRLERAGWRVLYEPRAVARTEAPETVAAFLKQRLRWMFGTLQSAYKNQMAMWRARPVGVGLFGLPNIIVFQFLFTLVAPIIDLMLVWTLLSGMREYAMRPHEGVPPTLLTVAAYWAIFQVLEVGAATLALAIDRKRDLWRLLPLLFVQRFCYRQLLYLCAIRVAIAALKGRLLGWNKLMRTGRLVVKPAHERPLLDVTG